MDKDFSYSVSFLKGSLGDDERRFDLSALRKKLNEIEVGRVSDLLYLHEIIKVNQKPFLVLRPHKGCGQILIDLEDKE